MYKLTARQEKVIGIQQLEAQANVSQIFGVMGFSIASGLDLD